MNLNKTGMAIRKRNKIKISNLPNKGKENIPKLNKVNLSLGLSDDEEEDNINFKLKPIKPNASFKMASNVTTNSGTRVNLYNSTTTVTEEEEEEDILYRDELNKLKSKPHEQPKQVIMNIEDMISAGEISDDNENTHNLFKDRNKNNNNNKRLSDREIRYQEKEYVKLMDENDKLTLIDTLTKNGRVKLSQLSSNEGEYKYNEEVDGGEFADERLPLSNREQRHQENLRRKQIEEAISRVPLEELKEKEDTISIAKPQLPTLYDDDEKLNLDDYNNIKDIINQNKLNIKKIEIEMKILTREKDNLINEKNNLIEQLNKISL